MDTEVHKPASVIQRMLSESPEPNVLQVLTRVNPIKRFEVFMQELSEQTTIEAQQAVSCKTIEKITKEGLKLHDGPFVKSHYVTLQNIGEQYFGCNPIHKT